MIAARNVHHFSRASLRNAPSHHEVGVRSTPSPLPRLSPADFPSFWGGWTTIGVLSDLMSDFPRGLPAKMSRQPVSPTLLLRYAAAKPDNKDKSDGFVPCNVRVSQELGNSDVIEW